MARLAPRLCVFSNQGKAGHAIVIEVDGLPGCRGMAPAAIGPISTFMRIVSGVTTGTRGGWLGGLCRLFVARGAGGRSVCTAQRKCRHLIMIKADLLPISGGMTRRAIGAVLPFVHVVAGMTAVAAARRIFDSVTRAMAGGAGRIRMAAGQRKAGC